MPLTSLGESKRGCQSYGGRTEGDRHLETKGKVIKEMAIQSRKGFSEFSKYSDSSSATISEGKWVLISQRM